MFSSYPISKSNLLIFANACKLFLLAWIESTLRALFPLKQHTSCRIYPPPLTIMTSRITEVPLRLELILGSMIVFGKKTCTLLEKLPFLMEYSNKNICSKQVSETEMIKTANKSYILHNQYILTING